jgi:hypothetical protein
MNRRSKHRRAWLSVFMVVALSVPVLADSFWELNVTDMAPYLGYELFLRVVDVETGEEVARFGPVSVQEDSQALEIQAAELASSYHIDLFVDATEDGGYDPPPADPSWRVELPAVQVGSRFDVSLDAAFTDIGWPPAIDGTIDTGEYPHTMIDDPTEMVVSWYNDESILYIGLASPGVGWLAIGFAPQRQMQGANIIIAAIDAGELTIEDQYGNTPTSHRRDDVDNIIQAAGSETLDGSVVEFAIPLDSGDDQDKALEPGAQVAILLAYHRSSDRLTMKHTDRSVSTIVLDN